MTGYLPTNVKEVTFGKQTGWKYAQAFTSDVWSNWQLTAFACHSLLRQKRRMKAKTNWCCRKNVHKAPGSAEECSKHDWLQSCFAKKVEHRLICFCRAERNVSSPKICRYHPTLPSFTLGLIFQIFFISTICHPGAVSLAFPRWFLFPNLEDLLCPAVFFCLSQYWFQV